MKSDRLKEAFHKLHAEEELKKHTAEYIFQRTHGYRKNKIVPYGKLAAVIACCLLLAAGWEGYSAYFTKTSVISIDINPSIELSINPFGKVISVETYNEDGYLVISSVDVRFKDYREALRQIFSSESMAQYLAQDYLIAITVFETDERKNQEILTNLTSCTASYGNICCASGSPEEAAAAHAKGMSFGKYKAFLELQSLDPDISAEEVKGLTMRQIRDFINKLSDEPKQITPDSQNSGYGNGNGYRKGNGRRDR